MATVRLSATKVRCVENQRTTGRAWIFYCDDGRRAYLSKSKCAKLDDPYISQALTGMKARENRTFAAPVTIYVVEGRHQLLVHRIVDGHLIWQSRQQGRLM